jgi:hypothetical protein
MLVINRYAVQRSIWTTERIVVGNSMWKKDFNDGLQKGRIPREGYMYQTELAVLNSVSVRSRYHRAQLPPAPPRRGNRPQRMHRGVFKAIVFRKGFFLMRVMCTYNEGYLGRIHLSQLSVSVPGDPCPVSRSASQADAL